MRRTIRVIYVLTVALLFLAPVYCGAEEEIGTAKMIAQVKEFIEAGDSEQALSTLDAAYAAANSAGDYDALMEIGDLYIAIDPSLGGKAMDAWTAAGRAKCR